MAWGKLRPSVASTLAENIWRRVARSAVRDLLEPARAWPTASLWLICTGTTRPRGAWTIVTPHRRSAIRRQVLPRTAAWSPRSPVRGVLREARPPRHKQQALRLLVHLVEISIQPLHVGITQPRGQRSAGQFFGQEQNLHYLWDEGMMSTAKDEHLECATSSARHPDRPDDGPRGTEAAARRASPRPVSYASPEAPHRGWPRGAQLGDSYYRLELPVVRRTRAGGRTPAGCSTRLSIAPTC